MYRNTSLTSNRVLKFCAEMLNASDAKVSFVSCQYLAGELAHSRYSVHIVKRTLGLTEKYSMNYCLHLLWMHGEADSKLYTLQN